MLLLLLRVRCGRKELRRRWAAPFKVRDNPYAVDPLLIQEDRGRLFLHPVRVRSLWRSSARDCHSLFSWSSIWIHVHSIFRFRGDRGRRFPHRFELTIRPFEYAFVQCRVIIFMLKDHGASSFLWKPKLCDYETKTWF